MTFPVEPNSGSSTAASPSSRRPRHSKRRYKGRRHRARNAAIITVGVLILIGAVGYGYARYRYGQIKKLSVGNLATAQANQPMNILIVGSNSRAVLNGKQAAAFGTAKQVGGARSDVTMVLHLDPATGQASLVSIPRDLFMPIPGSTLSNRVDSALNQGPSQLVKTVEQDLGISISHYVEVNFDSFQNIVNTLGGLHMYFPYPVKDAYSGLNVQTTGCHYLNGTQALQVVRARHLYYKTASGTWVEDPLGDLSRIRRDHEFMRVLFASVKHKGISNPLTLNAILSSVAPQLKVDSGFTLGDMVSIASKFRNLNPNTIPTATLPVALENNYVYNGANYGDVVFPAEPQDLSIVNKYLNIPQPTISKSSFSISVLNGTGQYLQASKVAAELKADGFTVSSTGNTKILGNNLETIIRYRPGYLEQARVLRNSLSGAIIMGNLSTTSGPPVQLITGTTLTIAKPTTTSSSPATSPSSTASKGVSSTTAVTTAPITLPATRSVNPLQPWDPRACPSNG